MAEFAVIGDPIAQSKSPELHAWFFNEMNIKARTERVHCDSTGLDFLMESFKRGKWDGLNITIPHKESVIDYLDRIDPGAKAIGAVNCIVNRDGQLYGTNTDRYGFLKMILENRVDTVEKKCLVLGAGGAGKTAVTVLADLGVTDIHVWSRNYSNAELLVKSLKATEGIFNACNDVDLEIVAGESDILVNCTPLGMGALKNQSPIEAKSITERHTLLDCVYNPLKTKLIFDGEKAGAKTVGGLDMFIYQGLYTMKTWFPDLDWESIPMDDLREFIKILVEKEL